MVSLAGRISLSLMGPYSMTKYSLVAFTEILRRELAKFNIRVTSIEPASLKENLFDQTLVLRNIDENCKHTSNHVRKAYESRESIKKSFLSYYNMFTAEENIDIVVNDMIDAINNRWPKHVYKPMSLFSKIVFSLITSLPTDLTDWLIRFGQDNSLN